MKHLFNNLSDEEKNSIREQHEGGMMVDTSKFKKLLESKLGDSKPLISERNVEQNNPNPTGGGGSSISPQMGMDMTGLNAISQMKNIPGTNIPGGKDKWGRQPADCWYGFNPTSKMFEDGPCKGIAGKDFTTKCKPKKQNCFSKATSVVGTTSTTGSTNNKKVEPAKDRSGRSYSDCWYGYNSQLKKFEMGPCTGILGKDFATQCKPKKPNCNVSVPKATSVVGTTSITGSTR